MDKNIKIDYYIIYNSKLLSLAQLSLLTNSLN